MPPLATDNLMRMTKLFGTGRLQETCQFSPLTLHFFVTNTLGSHRVMLQVSFCSYVGWVQLIAVSEPLQNFESATTDFVARQRQPAGT